jgi:AraC-like DNA-binding protein
VRVRFALFYAHDLADGFRYGWHSHPYWELLLMSGSGGHVESDGGRRRFADGDLVINPPGTRHVTTMDGLARHLALGMNGAELDDLPSGVVTPDAELRRCYAAMDAAARRAGRFHRHVIECRAMEVVWRLKQQLSPHAPRPDAERAETIKGLLDRAYRERISLARISERVCLSKDYVRHLFRREYGVGPIQYLIRKRLEEARYLLLEGDRPIQAIAAACGFRDPFHFSHLFKKAYGSAPAHYRQERRGR